AAFRHTKIRVRVMRAETAPGMLIAQATQNFCARETQILEQVASVLGQAAPMRVHVANGDLASYPRIEHCECWIECAELRIPGYFSFTDELGYHGRANRLGKRGELKDCVRVDWHFCVRIANAESFRVHSLILKHDRDCEPGQRVFLNLLLRELFQLLNRMSYLLGSDARFFGCDCNGLIQQGQ